MHILLVLACLGVSPALAQDPPAEQDDDVARAKELYENGAALYDEGNYEAAIEAWGKAYELSEKPLLLFNLSSAWEKMGNLEKALEMLNKYRVYAPADERNTLEARIRNLERRIERAHENDPDPDPDPEPEPKSGGSGNTVGVVLISVGGVGLGTGTLFAVRASGAKKTLKESCTEDGLCPATSSSDLGKHRSSTVIADIGFVVGAVGLGLGTFMTLGGGSADVEVWTAPTPDGGQLGLRGRF